MKTRIVVSLLLAAPLAILSLAIGDIAGLPDAIRYVVSPGFMFGLHASPSGSWIGDISDALRIAIAGNEIYYALLIFLLLGWRSRNKSAPASGEEVAGQRRA